MILRVIRVCTSLIIAAALVVMAVLAAIYLPGLHRGGAASGPVTQDFSRTDFITIILTAASLMLATLGLVLALAGAVGYVTVRTAAEKAAEDAARRAAEKVAGASAEAVATRLVRELLPQLLTGVGRSGPDEGDAFAKAEGEK